MDGRRLRPAILTAALLTLSVSGAHAAWDLFGDILLTGGRAANPRLLDSEQPASERRGQRLWTARLLVGADGAWEKGDFALSYQPYFELYEDDELTQLSHALNLSYDYRFTPRVAVSLKEDFSYNPELPTDPNATGIGGALVSDSSVMGSDFRERLLFRTTEKSSLGLSYRNVARIYSSDQLLDMVGNAFGGEYSRTFGARMQGSAGYEFSHYSFDDGLPPEVTAAFTDFCAMTPTDPNCVTYFALLAQPPAEDQGFNRHRAYAGYRYDVPAGIHFDIDAGYDRLVYTEDEFGSLSRPFVRTSVGWNGVKIHARGGYEQGLDEGGGILTTAELRRAQANARFRFTDHAMLDLSVARDVRQSVGIDTGLGDTTLMTVRGGSFFTYELPHGLALVASYTHDWQKVWGTTAIPTESRTYRYGLGVSWSFARRNAPPDDSSEGITGHPSGG